MCFFFRNLKENSKGKQEYDPTQDPVLNEFKRENVIHRQAQAAVLEGLKRLKELKIPTRRYSSTIYFSAWHHFRE